MLLGVALLLRVGQGAQLVAALDHAKPGLLVALGCQRELHERRVAGHRLLPAGMVPAEGEASRRIDRLHDDRPALVPELHIAVRTGLDHELHPAGEPLAYLIGLGDGAPHHLRRRLDQNLPIDHKAWHQHSLPSMDICNQR